MLDESADALLPVDDWPLELAVGVDWSEVADGFEGDGLELCGELWARAGNAISPQDNAMVQSRFFTCMCISFFLAVL
jgi:hypothetical protein